MNVKDIPLPDAIKMLKSRKKGDHAGGLGRFSVALGAYLWLYEFDEPK